MHILLAPDRFPGTLTAVQAARTLAEGWRVGAPGDTVVEVPLSDGSAGLLDVVVAAHGGELVPVPAPGPLGGAGPAAVLHVPGTAGGTAYVEADQVLGTHLVRAPDRPLAARTGTSAGLGHLLAAARATGARRVVVGLAGTSAVHDGGAGLLAALAEHAGIEPVGDVLTGGAAGLGSLTAADVEVLAAVRSWLDGLDVVLAVADDLPLLGLHGAGALLGGDPAVGPVLAQELERALGHATHLLEQRAAALPRARAGLAMAGHGGASGAVDADHGRTGTRPARSPGSGAGGGVAFLLQLLGARALPGAEVVAAAVDLRSRVLGADLLVTGARVLDAASLTESVVATVARQALPLALPVVVVAEEVRTSRREIAPLGISGTYEVRDRRRGPARAGAHGSHVEDAPGVGADLRGALAARAARVARTWST